MRRFGHSLQGYSPVGARSPLLFTGHFRVRPHQKRIEEVITADTYEPLDVEQLCVGVEADVIAAGNAEIERQGLERTVANNAAIGWHAVRIAEARHVVARIEALRRAGHERAAVAIMRELPAPDEPADDVQEEWALLNRPFDYHMYEREAYAS